LTFPFIEQASNNILEQDHRFIKRRVNPSLGFFSFNTARRTIKGFEAMNMIRKGQIDGVGKGDIRGQQRFVNSLFRAAA
jgi:transposase-like protein